METAQKPVTEKTETKNEGDLNGKSDGQTSQNEVSGGLSEARLAARASASNAERTDAGAAEENAGDVGARGESGEEASEEGLPAGQVKEQVRATASNAERTDAGTAEESKEALQASRTEEKGKARLASESGTPAEQSTGITWAVDGDAMTISGEGTKDGLSNEFWTALRNAKSIQFVDCTITGSMKEFFKGIGAQSIDGSGLDTSGVTDMSAMFSDCRSLTSLNVSGWNTGNVTDMSHMFAWCTNLMDLGVGGWNTRNVTDMSSMFAWCTSLTELDVSRWDTRNVMDMSSMFFWGSGSLLNLDVSGWDTGNVTSMKDMFCNFSSLTSLDVSRWDTGNVTDMSAIFAGCQSLTNLNVSEWNTRNVVDMSGMFGGCRSLTSLNVSEWDTGNVTNMDSVFGSCCSLTDLDVSGWNTRNVTTMRGTFSGCWLLTSLNVSGWNTGNVMDMESMFSTCYNLTSLNVSEWDTGNVTNMKDIFGNCSSLLNLDVSGWNTRNVTNMYGTFAICRSLPNLDVSGWNTSKVVDMDFMFYGCRLMNLDLSGWDTGNVRSMDFMFGFSYITNLDLSEWDAGGLERAAGMFDHCSGLMTLKTPRKLSAITIFLPDAFFDPIGRMTSLLTPEFCNTILTRVRPDQLTLTGSITGHQGVAYASVTAKLVGLDGTSYTAEVTGADSLDGTQKKECTYSVQAPAGQYSLEVEAETWAGVKVNRSAVVKLSADGQTKDVNLPNGQAKTKVEGKNGANALVGGLDALILKSDDTLMGSASAAEIVFTVDSAENWKDGAEAAVIRSAAPAQMMEFYDFSIRKTVDGTESQITDTESAVTIVLPFEKQGKKNVKVYRYHGGAVDTLTERETGGEKIEVNEESITIYAKKFSVYAVGYTVSAGEGTDSDDNPGGSSGSTGGTGDKPGGPGSGTEGTGGSTGGTGGNHGGSGSGSDGTDGNPGGTGGSPSDTGSSTGGSDSSGGTYDTTSDPDDSYRRPVSHGKPAAIQPAAGAKEDSAFLKPQDVDWKNVLAQVNEAQGGENVNVLTGSSFTVPEEIIRALAGTDKTLAMQLGHGTAVSLSGVNIRKAEAWAAPGLILAEASDIPETAKQGIAQGVQAARELTVQPAGELPYFFHLHFALGKENAGKRAYFYRYDEKEGRLSPAGSMRVTAEGQAMFALKEGGSFLVALAEDVAGEVYTVVRGDTILKIAASHGVSLKALLAANPQIRNINRIYPGQVLRIPRDW